MSELEQHGSVNGSVASRGVLSGSVASRGVLSGVVAASAASARQPYEGDYIVVPTFDYQSLPTADRYLTADVDVLPIPVTRASNPSGGITATIG